MKFKAAILPGSLILGVVAVAATLSIGNICAVAKDRECEMIPPVRVVDATSMYSDAKGSVTDETKAALSRQQLAGIDVFFKAMETALDNSSDRAVMECAFRQFQEWADGAAMTEAGSNEGSIQRLEYLVGLEIIAVKFKASGYPPTSKMVNWMQNITAQVMKNYQNNRRPEIRGNLYYWSGVDAALSALVSTNPAALAYQDTVWREALADIKSDGTLDREMKRGQRALIYHQYAFAALTVLRAVREALHMPTGLDETRQLKRLADTIGATMCHPEDMAQRAGVAKMEMPGDWAYRMNTVFGSDLLSEEWHRCGLFPVNPVDVRFGGLSTRSLDAIRAVGRM